MNRSKFEIGETLYYLISIGKNRSVSKKSKLISIEYQNGPIYIFENGDRVNWARRLHDEMLSCLEKDKLIALRETYLKLSVSDVFVEDFIEYLNGRIEQ